MGVNGDQMMMTSTMSDGETEWGDTNYNARRSLMNGEGIFSLGIVRDPLEHPLERPSTVSLSKTM